MMIFVYVPIENKWSEMIMKGAVYDDVDYPAIREFQSYMYPHKRHKPNYQVYGGILTYPTKVVPVRTICPSSKRT